MNILASLNPEQQKAVTHENGPLLIVAGAGTGKTTVVTKRIAWLILEKKINPEEILALTFTDKASGEMEERIDKMLPYGYVDLWISTFHSFAERILRQHGLDIGLPADFKLLNQTEQWMLVRKNLDKFDLNYYRPLGNPTKFIHALIKHFSRCKDEDILPKDYLEFIDSKRLNKDLRKEDGILKGEIARLDEIANSYHIYQKLLLDNSALDFGDLILYCLKLFKERPQILEKYHQQFQYILVDEFQDTNWSQYELVKLLAEPKNNLTVVGDDDQSIFAFRGASMSNILHFTEDYPRTQKVFITKNYRSAQEILDLSYDFIKLNNPNRLEVKLSEAKNNLSKKLVAQKDIKGQIEHLHFTTGQDEAEGVAKKIIELKNENQNLTWNDFAILVRANSTADSFLRVLENRELPHQFLASKGLFVKPIILDIVAYLKLLDNYHESSAVFRILSAPIFDLASKDLADLSFLAGRKTWSLFEAVKNSPGFIKFSEEIVESLNKFLGLVEKHSALTREKTVSKVVLAFLEDSGYLKILTREDSLKSRAELSCLNQFFKEMKSFEEANADKSVKAFLDQLDYILESGDAGSLIPNFEEGPEAIKILTVHSSKGLEFEYVFMVNLVDKKFPTIERKDPIELPDELVKEIVPEGDTHLEEERRLFYVGMTRAKKGLFFSSADNYGGKTKKKISRFLMAIESGEQKDKMKKIKLDPEKIDKTLNTNSVQYVEEEMHAQIPNRFSFTQLKAFETCPLQYKFSHILRIPRRGKGVFSFGRTMHNTLHRFFVLAKERSGVDQIDLFNQQNNLVEKSIKELVSLDELLKIYFNLWIDEWYNDKPEKEKYWKKGKESLKDFYEQVKEMKQLPKYLEKGFNLRIGQYTVRGVMDRVDILEKDGEQGIEIIDYKTGQAKEKLNPGDKEQLLIYQIAAQEVFQEKPVQLTFYYLDDNKKLSFLGKEKELEKIKIKIQETIGKIKSSDFSATPGMMCRYCDFKGVCEFRK